uniref:Pectin acetylesterase n=1 Tax=Solanum lycopersicum TaxID=4081 RepID=A0A3Q7HSX2_SOLLC
MATNIIFLIFPTISIAEAQKINITKVHTATTQGAGINIDNYIHFIFSLELDLMFVSTKTPPAYYFDWGFDARASSWIIYLQGGGWCENLKDCHYRTFQPTCSSNLMQDQTKFGGIFNNTPQNNPDELIFAGDHLLLLKS